MRVRASKHLHWKKYSHEFFQHYNFAKIRTCDSSRTIHSSQIRNEKKSLWPVPRFQCTFRGLVRQPVAPRFSRLIDLPRSFTVSPTYVYVYIYSRSVPPVRFTAFPPRCIHKTNPNSHGVALMPAERMRNAYACTAHIPVATGSMSSLCRCVNTRLRALSRATRVFVRGYGSERRARGPTGGSWHTSSGGFPSHVSRGENVPPAGRKGR